MISVTDDVTCAYTKIQHHKASNWRWTVSTAEATVLQITD